MFVIHSQKEQFEDWISNSTINETERKKIYNWIVNSPVDIYIPRIPPVRCSISAGWCQGDYNGYVVDILAHIDYFDWMSYKCKEFSYIPIDSEIINYLNWIGDIPTGRFSIDQRTGYFHQKDYKNKRHIEKADKKISIYLIKEDNEFYKINSEKNFNTISIN